MQTERVLWAQPGLGLNFHSTSAPKAMSTRVSHLSFRFLKSLHFTLGVDQKPKEDHGNFFLKTGDLFTWKAELQRGGIFHLLVHFQDGCNDQSWARLKAGVGTPAGFAVLVAQAHTFVPSSVAFQGTLSGCWNGSVICKNHIGGCWHKRQHQLLHLHLPAYLHRENVGVLLDAALLSCWHCHLGFCRMMRWNWNLCPHNFISFSSISVFCENGCVKTAPTFFILLCLGPQIHDWK